MYHPYFFAAKRVVASRCWVKLLLATPQSANSKRRLHLSQKPPMLKSRRQRTILSQRVDLLNTNTRSSEVLGMAIRPFPISQVSYLPLFILILILLLSFSAIIPDGPAITALENSPHVENVERDQVVTTQ